MTTARAPWINRREPRTERHAHSEFVEALDTQPAVSSFHGCGCSLGLPVCSCGPACELPEADWRPHDPTRVVPAKDWCDHPLFLIFAAAAIVAGALLPVAFGEQIARFAVSVATRLVTL